MRSLLLKIPLLEHHDMYSNIDTLRVSLGIHDSFTTFQRQKLGELVTPGWEKTVGLWLAGSLG